MVCLAVTSAGVNAASSARATSPANAAGAASPANAAPAVHRLTTAIASESVNAKNAVTAVSSAASRAATARAQIKKLTKTLGAGGVSVAALSMDEHGAKPFTYGATHGMRVGSIIKLLILEELMYKRTHAGRWLTGHERALAVKMIEVSDNDAAYNLYLIEGGKPALQAMARRLHLHHTTIDGTHFGLSTTSATDFVTIWSAFLRHKSVLNLQSRKYARYLTSHVTGWQRWGIGAAGDAHSTLHNKNGWLSVDADRGRWLVNSTGMVYINHHRYQLVVLTQHGASFNGGITRVEKIAKAAVRAVD